MDPARPAHDVEKGPQVPLNVAIHRQLHDYQKVAKDFIMTRPKSGLFLDVGFGKTITTLSALLDLSAAGELDGNILVIAPKAIARSTWIDELNDWKIPANWTSLIVNERGKQLSRKKRLERYDEIYSSPSAFYFLNKELVTDIVQWCLDNRRPWPFPNVVVDELQGFKSYSAARFKALMKTYGSTRRLIGLTGTPVPNGLMDLWSEICLMDGGQRLGKNITAYRNAYFVPGLIVNNYPVTWALKPGAENAIYNAVKDIVISVKGGLKLPPFRENPIRVHMDDQEMKVYRKMATEQVLRVQSDGGVKTVTAANSAVLLSRLSQLASGTLYTGDGKEYAVLHRQKLDVLEYIVGNTGSPVLVAYYFKSEKTEIENHFAKLGIPCETLDGSPEMIHRWNQGQIPLMLLHPASVGHGINIQFGGHTLVWYTLPTSLEHFIQTIGRLRRQGQAHPVVVHYLLAEGTVDKRNLTRLMKKDATERGLMAAVAGYLSEDLGVAT